jgi:hypothetical protein
LSVKDDVLEDLPHLYPALTREQIEKVLTLLDAQASADGGLSVATALEPLTPDIAARVKSLNDHKSAAEYMRVLRGAAILVLQEWKPGGDAPTPDHVYELVRNTASE